MNERSSSNKKLEIIYLIASGIITAVMITVSVIKAQGIFFPTDEFGYWENAAAILGTDWTGVTGGAKNYAIGYSAILLPIMAMTGNAVIMYRTALIINALLLILSSYLFICLIRIMYGKVTAWVLPCIVFPAYLIYMSYTISEVLLYVLFLALCLVTAKISLGKGSPMLICLGILLCGLMICVHYRTVGIAVIFVLVCIINRQKEAIPDKKLLLVSCAVLLILLIAMTFYSLTGGRIGAKVFSPMLLSDFLLGLAGKVFYLGASTFGLGIIGLTLVYKKRSNLFNLFFLLSFAYMVILASFYFCGGLRMDQPVYGRYGEMFIPLLLYIGSEEISSHSLWMRTGIFMGITAAALTLYVTQTHKTEYVADFVNGIDWMYGEGMPKLSVAYIGPFVITTAALFVLERLSSNEKRRRICALFVACAFIFMTFFLSWKHVWRFQDMDTSDRELAENTLTFADDGKEVIFLNSPYNDYVNLIQFWFMDKKIDMTEGLDPEAFNTPRDAVVITYKNYERSDQLIARYPDRRSSAHFEMYYSISE